MLNIYVWNLMKILKEENRNEKTATYPAFKMCLLTDLQALINARGMLLLHQHFSRKGRNDQ